MSTDVQSTAQRDRESMPDRSTGALPPMNMADSKALTIGANPRRWHVLGLLAVAQVMLVLDITVVAVAIPDLGSQLGMGREGLTWVMSGYTLAFGGLMLLAGRAADVLGPRALLFAGLGIFTLASFAVGLAPTGGLVIAGRVVQGVGAAMLSPAALSIVVRLFEGEERNKAIGIWSSLGGVGAAAGVLLGGLLTAGPGWEWAFFVNVPIGAVLLVGLHRLLPPLAPWGVGARLDVAGAVLVTAGTSAITFAFIGAGERGWRSVTTIALVAGGMLAYAAFGFWLTRTRAPLVNPGLMTRRSVVAGTFLVFVTTGLMVASFFLGTFYLQEAAELGPLMTGLLFLPVALATIVGAQVAGHLIARTGARVLAVIGMVIAAFGLLTPALDLNAATVVIAVSVGATGLGALFVVAAATALGQVAPAEAGIASGLLNTCHELGSALGAAVASGVAAGGLVAGIGAGFERGYMTAAVIAMVAAGIAGFVVPGRNSR